MGPTNVHGYGRRHGDSPLAAREAWELVNGPMAPGLEPDHLCRNRICCNPKHLEAVTRRENLLRSNAVSGVNARKTHCVRGHELAGSNIRVDRRGKRVCRACARNRDAAMRELAARSGLVIACLLALLFIAGGPR